MALDGSFRRNTATLGGLHIGKKSRHPYLISSAENLYFTANVARDSGDTIILKHGRSLNLGGLHYAFSHSRACFVHRALIANNIGSFGGGHSDNSKLSLPRARMREQGVM